MNKDKVNQYTYLGIIKKSKNIMHHIKMNFKTKNVSLARIDKSQLRINKIKEFQLKLKF